MTSAFVAIESPLDAAADGSFALHMVQHLVLTDLTAPFVLLGGPLLLLFTAVPPPVARRISGVLHSHAARALTFPGVTWSAFILALWIVHFSGFFELALENERVHLLEHALFVSTAFFFWLPVIAIGPTPWTNGPLAYPLRMLYLFLAMPAEAFLGFALYSARHVLYASYRASGLADQQAAGEIMWVGGTLFMFVAFMLVGADWARHEQRQGERIDARLARETASFSGDAR